MVGPSPSLAVNPIRSWSNARSRLDGRWLALPRATTCAHVQEVVIAALVPRCVRVLALRALVKEADVMIYAIGIYDRYFQSQEEQLGPQLLGEIAELTGGRAFTVQNPNDLADVATKIGIELRNQYVLGFRPSKGVRDGKWRKIKVKLLPPKGLPPLRVYARTGYYAPEE